MSHSVGHEDIPRDPELLRLYREAAQGEPPSALDHAILRAATREVAPPRLGVWWRGWLGPVSLFATVVLTASVTLLVHEERQREEVEAARVPADSPQVTPGEGPRDVPEFQRPAPAAPPGSFPAPAATPQAPSTGKSSVRREDSAKSPPPARDKGAPPAEKAKPAVEAPTERAPSSNVLPEALQDLPKEEAADPASAPEADSGVSRDVQKGEQKKAAPAASVPRPAASEPAGRLEMRRRQVPSVRSNAESESSLGASEKPSLTAPEPVRGAERGPRSPEAWLDEIRAMKRQGREAEAQDALAQFRRIYPAYPVPEDLR